MPEAEPAAPIVKRFKTASGKAIFMRGDWRQAESIFERFKPRDGELWVLNGRVNHIWQTMYDDLRKPFVRQRYPSNFLLINAADAKPRGIESIESGDLVRVENDDVVDQLGNKTKGVLSLVAYVTDEVAPGRHLHLRLLSRPELECGGACGHGPRDRRLQLQDRQGSGDEDR